MKLDEILMSDEKWNSMSHEDQRKAFVKLANDHASRDEAWLNLSSALTTYLARPSMDGSPARQEMREMLQWAVANPVKEDKDGNKYFPWLGNYDKIWYDVCLADGTVLKHCWPNAGRLNPMVTQRHDIQVKDKVWMRVSPDHPADL